MQNKRDLCTILYQDFKKKKQKHLRRFHDRLLKEAVLSLNKDYYELAVISYVLSKILSKSRYLSGVYREPMEEIEINLVELIENCNSPKEWKKSIKDLETSIKNLEKEDPRFVITLIYKGKIKSAAVLYAQGISLGLASQITGVEKQEILNYAGKTMMFDRLKEEKGILERVKMARSMIE